jgi:hypothetical protein
MGGWIDVWMVDGWVGGWMDEWAMNRQVNGCVMN